MSQQGLGCAEVEHLGDCYVDGELQGEDRAAFEQHVGECGACGRRVRHLGTFKAQLKAAMPRTAAPDVLKARVRSALDEAPQEPHALHRALNRFVPMAAAAALLVGLVVHKTHSKLVTGAVVDTFRNDLPLDVKGPADVVRAYLNQRVEFAVRPPDLPNANLLGARLAHIREHQAAYLAYDMNGNRVVVFVFDPTDLPMEGNHRRYVSGHEVLVDGDRGYNVALIRERGVAYAFAASDLNEDQMVQLVSSAIR